MISMQHILSHNLQTLLIIGYTCRSCYFADIIRRVSALLSCNALIPVVTIVYFIPDEDAHSE